jgi:hypothetical protein
MGQTNYIVSLLILFAIVAVVFRRSMLDALMDGINAVADNLRGGGPPPPMHPSPADDGALLRRRSHTDATQIHANQAD